MELDVVVAGDGREEDRVSNWVDGDKHIDITATAIGDIAIRIGTANEDGKRLCRDVDIGMRHSGVGRNFELDSVNNAGIGGKIGIVIINNIEVDGAEENSVGGMLSELFGEGVDIINRNEIGVDGGLEVEEGFLIDFEIFVVSGNGFTSEIGDSLVCGIMIYDNVVFFGDVILVMEATEEIESLGEVGDSGEIDDAKKSGDETEEDANG